MISNERTNKVDIYIYTTPFVFDWKDQKQQFKITKEIRIQRDLKPADHMKIRTKSNVPERTILKDQK